MPRRFALILSLMLLWIAPVFVTAAQGRVVNVINKDGLSRAIRSARPGDTIRLSAGNYGSLYAARLVGAAGAPITIESADPANPARFGNRHGEGIHLVEPAHVVLRQLHIVGCTDNGLNIDDGGKRDGSAHHIILDRLTVADIGPKGNFDAIKLSGVNDFELRNCTVNGWGGSGVDMVGCHRGLIAGCTFRGKKGFSQHDGVQIKGGSESVVVLGCLFVDAGGRAVNLGGVTGAVYFRPPLEQMARPYYEAKDCTVENNRFIGGEAAVAFVSQQDCAVRFNTIYRPRKYPFRILQETSDARFAPSSRGKVEHNLIVWRPGDMYTAVNIGAGTNPRSFIFHSNAWYCQGKPGASRPSLPVAETDAMVGIDPQLKDPENEDLTITNAKLAKLAGPDALPTSASK